VTARRVTALLCAAAALAAPAAARADGDPASDVLLFQDVYMPYFPAPSQAEAETLERLLREVKAKGYPMKVALIQTRGDLGAYPDLFGRPADYAELLSGEIAFRVRNPHLLIVMAEGGLAGRNLGPEAEDLLADIEIDAEAQSDGLVRAALEAVAAVASANGHETEVPEIEADAGGGRGSHHGESHTALYVISGIIVLLGIALIAVSFLRPGRPARG
jgi:hypothetical protein